MKHLLLTSFSIFLFACNAPIKPILVDNPTDSTITVQFNDGESFTINAGESKTISVPFGKSTIKVNNSDSYEIELDPEKEYLLNPSMEDYYLQKIIYFMSARAEKKYIDDYGSIKSQVDGREVNGDFTKISGKIAIPKTWTYGLDDDPQTHATVKFAGSKTHVSTNKLHRKKDLVETINMQIQESIQELLNELEVKADAEGE